MQVIEFIGNLVDAINFTIGITPQRKIDIMKELNRWRFKINTTRRELEVLVGKLQFISNCLRPGRLFMSRLLNELKAMKRDTQYVLTPEVRKDIMWWYLMVPKFDGTAIMWLIDEETIDQEMATDSCLIGAGGVHGQEYYRVQFRAHLQERGYQIAHWELLAIILDVRLWGEQLMGKFIRMYTDNEAVSIIINTGRSRDLKLQKQLRELN